MSLKKRWHKFEPLILLALIIFLATSDGQSMVRAGYSYGRGLAEQTGAIKPQVYVAGTGSMYPTFPKGSGKTTVEQLNEVVGSHRARTYPAGFTLFGREFFGYQLQRGDIIVFANDKTREIIAKDAGDPDVGFIKRIIALPGDTLEIRDGFVKLNDKILSEPYIASARSTYGGDFLPDCQKLKIPEGKVFVMGDNRKGSDDSRFEVGLVDIKDIRNVIPTNDQNDLKKNWRDTANDTKTANQATLDAQEYLRLLNQQRQQAGLKPLKYQQKLAESAAKRADTILKYNDLSFEATRSGYTMASALRDVGYSNVVTGEAPTLGYYEAEELVDNYLQFPKTKTFLLNPEFQETGVAVRVGTVNNCPTQVVVQHLAGYVPPNYDQKDLQSWQKLIDNLNDVIPSWEQLKGEGSVNQDDLKKLLDLLNNRRTRAQIIHDRIKSNQWLTDEQNKWIDEDKSLHDQIEVLVNRLNGR